MNRRIVFINLAFAVLLGGMLLYEINRPPTFYGVVLTPPKPLPDFTLQSGNGLVKFSDFRGNYVLLYFGYTSCPDLCPTTLAKLRQVVNQLGDKATQVQVIFVSVDYSRDTPERVAAYVKHFGPDFIGLAGSKEQIDRVTKDYGIYYKINIPDSKTGFYSVDHSASVPIFDRQGYLAMTWPYGLELFQMEEDLVSLMNK